MSSEPLYRKARWGILALLFVSTVINYIDRQTLSILATTIQADLKMDDGAYAGVVQLFLIAYTAAYFVVGWLTDKLGARVALALFVTWWSVANLLTGFVRTVPQLGAARFALGLGEAGNYVAAPKAVSEHFPPHERGYAIGIYTAGAMVGATIAPPLIGWLALSYGWRAAFVATGAIGFVWVLGWLLLGRNAMVSAKSDAVQEPRWPLHRILSEKSVWGLALARTISDPVWYFYLFWFPKYLGDARGLSLLAIASTAWLVYLAADLGSVGGGWLSGRLIRNGTNSVTARLRVMAVAAGIAPFGGIIAFAPAIPVTYALAALVALAHMAFLVNLSTLIVDRFPPRQVATIFGFVAAGSGLGGILSTQFVGALAATHDYAAIFAGMALLHPIAWTIARLTAGRPDKEERG